MVGKGHIPQAGKQIRAALKRFEALRSRKAFEPKTGLNMTPQALQKIKQMMDELS